LARRFSESRLAIVTNPYFQGIQQNPEGMPWRP